MTNYSNSIRRSAGGPWSLGAGGVGGAKPTNAPQTPQPSGAAAQQAAQVQLTRHEKRSFVAQTVHLAGNAYVDCTFDSCTLILSNAPFVFSGQCRVQRCNWRIEYDLLWGAPAMRAQLRQILDSMDSVVDPPPATA
ncbi:MAG: hypothetical protein EXS17_02100 [Phycisphaerales bacterium]|nr:hypothetical protein [Phycisphaerales bacterium]